MIPAKANIAEGRPLRGVRPLKCQYHGGIIFCPPEAQCHLFEDFWCLHKAKGKILSWLFLGKWSPLGATPLILITQCFKVSQMQDRCMIIKR